MRVVILGGGGFLGRRVAERLAASGTLGGGASLEILQVAGNANALTQGFGNLTINQGAHTITLTNNSASSRSPP